MSKRRSFSNKNEKNRIDGFKIRYCENQPYFNYNHDDYEYYNDPTISHENNFDWSDKNLEVKVIKGNCTKIRTIERVNLLRNPDMNKNRYLPPSLNSEHKNNWICWQRGDNTFHNWSQNMSKTPKKAKGPIKNKLTKTIDKMLAGPVEMSKGKSLLEKMGWKGGGLGKDGDGIVEPIAPEATYAVKTLGLGHASEQRPMRYNDDDIEYKNYFRTNVLLEILDFVKNNGETDVLFDKSLRNIDRKRIHNLVEDLRECKSVDELYYDEQIDLDIAKDILERKTYILSTKSDGKASHRQLCLYKDPPENVFLVMPGDLREDDESEEKDETPKDKDEKTKDKDEKTKDKDEKTKDKDEKTKDNDDEKIDKEEPQKEASTDNPEDVAVNVPKDDDSKNSMRTLLRLLIDYFKEFDDDSVYEEFRFLGAFDDEEAEAITVFFNICLNRNVECPGCEDLCEELSNMFYRFDFKEDINGGIIIHKIDKCLQLSS